MSWSAKKAARRIDLLDLQRSRGLDVHEEAELAGLQVDVREKLAPIQDAQIAALEKLLRNLKRSARRKKKAEVIDEGRNT